MDPYLISLIAICLSFSALFSGIEIAFISSNRLHIELQGKQGSKSGRIISKFANNPSRFISTILLGNNLALVLYGILMAFVLEPWISNILPTEVNNQITVLLIQTIISTLIVLITAEFLPKSIFMINPYFLLSVFSFSFLIIYYILFPAVFLISLLSKFFITRILRLEYSEDKPIFSLTDLNQYVKNLVETNTESSQEEEINTKIFHNALEFKTVKIRECMIPRTEIIGIDLKENIDELKSIFIDSGHSKIIIYEKSIDNVVGYCHTLELFKKPKHIKDILTKITIVPETMAANELLIQLISEHRSMALVVDEYGGTSGIVTIEDIIEEIFGEIEDEHDDDDKLTEISLDDNTFILSGRLEIDYLNDKYPWELPEGEYDTLGGMVLSINENLPTLNQVINFSRFSVEIISMEDTRIEKIKLHIDNTLTEV
ncbi:MAG: hemolysin family protein [Cyclobacteriaceae bacterium]|jgi:putative hemolysin|nr:hemolysin family protein [Cyclobacteriaceae bacterium]